MRIAIHVRPGARETRVAGEHDGALVVRVRARPEQGRATEAALAAVAAAFGVPRGAVSLAAGPASRRKLVDVDGARPETYQALLLGRAAERDHRRGSGSGASSR